MIEKTEDSAMISSTRSITSSKEYAKSRKKPCKSLLNEVALHPPHKISEMITKKVYFKQHPKVVHITPIQGPKGKLAMILSISS